MKRFNYLLTALLALNLVHVNAQCNVIGSHYTGSASGWSAVTDLGDGVGTASTSCGDGRNGNIYSWGTAVYFNTARDGREIRLSRSIPALSDQNWTMDFTLNITAPPGGTGLVNNSPSVTLASLTTDQMNLQSGCSGGNLCTPCSSYPNTNMDAMWVVLTSNTPSGCTGSQSDKNWRIVAYARDGSGTPVASTPISITSGANGTYYIRLQRTTSGTAQVSVCSNANYSTHLTGSPQCFTIPGSVTGLDCLNHEVHSQESCQRVFNGIVDHMKIDNSLPCAPAANPSFVMVSQICQDQPIVVNGSASTSGASSPITSHVWAVQECNANGNQFGPVWYSSSISGAPASDYTIGQAGLVAAGISIACNRYYKISLAVSTCGNPWTATSQVLYVACAPPLHPSFSFVNAVCFSNPIVVNGSASTSSGLPINSHRWVVEQCDASGNQFGPVWYGPSISGAPVSDYTINTWNLTSAGVSMSCNIYYKVSLVLTNCGNPWTVTSQVRYVNCSPAIDPSSSSVFVAANTSYTANLNAVVTGGTAPYWVSISTGTYTNPGNIFNGPPTQLPVATQQYVPTSYFFTVWDNLGCFSETEWFVEVRFGARPEFDVVISPENATEFTLEAQPRDVTGYEYPGFMYSHVIQELDVNGDPYYSVTSPGCWTNYPDAEVFKGFVSTGTGTYTQASDPLCGDPGRFLMGHTYRLTTVMKNDDMEEEQYAVLVYFEKSGQMVVTEDKDAPDMTDLPGERKPSVADNITIFPNPSTGIFTIELEEGMDVSLIEVTNALGQQVKVIEAKGLLAELDMTGFTKGIYIVTIVSNGSTTTKKIILE